MKRLFLQKINPAPKAGFLPAAGAILGVVFVTFFRVVPAVGQSSMSRAEYIERYSPIAVAHAEKYGIPASIKMAQGILESGYGNGTLAREANSHFNIKARSDWRGAVVYHDDDLPGEGFRAYDTPEDSWIDHSEYLARQPRYDSLFRHDVTDYRSWARGLKNAGYATDPLYAEKLIRVIEDNELWRLDRDGVLPSGGLKSEPAPSLTAGIVAAGTDGIDVDHFVVAMNHLDGRALLRTTDGLFIVARAGDTLARISELTGVRTGRLARINRMQKKSSLAAGQRIKIE